MAVVRKKLLIPSCRSWNASQNLRRQSKRLRKVNEKRSVAKKAAMLVILTQNRIVGTVVLENPVTAKDLNLKYVLLPPFRLKIPLLVKLNLAKIPVMIKLNIHPLQKKKKRGV